MNEEPPRGAKRVYEIPKISAEQNDVGSEYRQKRVVAYCRVSTKQEEQLNSYETQRAAYIEISCPACAVFYGTLYRC